jgi:hypothetical protein
MRKDRWQACGIMQLDETDRINLSGESPHYQTTFEVEFYLSLYDQKTSSWGKF